MSKRDLRTRTYRHRIRLQVIRMLGGKCKRCGFADARALQLDHIEGDGAKHYRQHHHFTVLLDLAQGRLTLARFQLLCANCNWIKRDEEIEHGHPSKYATTEVLQLQGSR